MYNIIVAMDKNNLIGKNGKLPWFNPEDLRHFKELTQDAFVIMGRKTYDSLPNKMLRNRFKIVLTKQEFPKEIPDSIYGPFFFHTLEGVDNFIASYKAAKRPVFVIGGEQIFKEYLRQDKIKQIIVSEIPGDFKGDTFFPPIESKKFRLRDFFQHTSFKEFVYERI